MAAQRLRSFLLKLAVWLFLIGLVSPLLLALSEPQKKLIDSGVRFFNLEEGVAECSTASTSGGDSNLDYAGRPVLTKGQLDKISKNQSVYEKAAAEVKIPWQMLAVVHLREHGLAVDNPSNGQGIYQFLDKHGGPYPTGPVTEAEFLRQSVLAAKFLKGKAGSNYDGNKDLTAQAPANVIKDTFFSYNGRAGVYEDQAVRLGFKRNEGYEGSPYVMNKADSRRDPKVNPTGWGQIKRDHGGIEYPANNDYGAFVTYAALAKIAPSCTTIETGGLAWPEKPPNSITSCFGPRVHPVTGQNSFHEGLDMANGSGTPILASAGGKVTFAGPAGGYGPHYVKIKHDSGIETSYGHMSSKKVSVGDDVTQGQEIGTEGSEGRSTGYHLHFNVIVGGRNQNPLKHLAIPEGVRNPKGCK